MKNLKIIWIYRLGLLLLVFLCLLVFLKIKPLWAPIIFVFKVAITPFLIACFIAYLLHPLIEKFIRKGCPVHLPFCSFISFSLAELVMGFIKEHQSLLNSYKRLMNNFPSLQRCTIRGWMALQNKQRISLRSFMKR